MSSERTVALIKKICCRHLDRGLQTPPIFVLVGDSAMGAHGLAPEPTGAQFYAPDCDHQSLREIEVEERCRIDAFTGLPLDRPVIIMDIADSPWVGNFRIRSGAAEVRSMRVEDLYLLKIAEGVDAGQFDSLPKRASLDDVIHRFRSFASWYYDRHALVAYADRFVVDAAARFEIREEELIDRLELSSHAMEG